MPTIVPAASRTMALLEVFARERRELANLDHRTLRDLGISPTDVHRRVPLNDQQIQTLGRDALQRAAAGDFAAAEEMFGRIVEARPNMGQALHLLGQFR
eukprot:gene10262-biopygen9006